MTNQLSASERVARSRTRLLLDSPFFGALSMRLRIVESTSAECPTMQTDGTELQYSAAFVDGLTDAELTGVLAHEVLHCALRHMYRINGRDMQEWNEACDYVVNAELIGAGFTLPNGALLDPSYAGMSAEQVYAKRGQRKQSQNGQPGGQGQPKQGQQGQQQPGQQGQQGQPSKGGQPQPGGTPAQNGQQSNAKGQGTPAPCPTGSFTAPPKSTQPDAGSGQQPGGKQPGGQPDVMTEQDWEIATEQAIAVSTRAGKMPGSVSRAVKVSREGVEDWRAILREFVEQISPTDYSWTQPNRRYIGAGIYLPGTVKENTPKFAIGIDTSGSISQELLNLFGAELTAILHESRPESIDVLYCDTRINGQQSFTPDDSEVRLTAVGGGGTRFSPVFHAVDSWDCPPAALIYFTDMESSDLHRIKQPEYPVLWVTTEATRRTAPFGRTVRLSQWA
jgi:predicted metal-dependent peptidase